MLIACQMTYQGGSLDLRGCGNVTLPNGLEVTGDLIVDRAQTKLPNGLTVRGNLDLRNSQVYNLPGTIAVHGYVDIRGSLVTSLATGISVGHIVGLAEQGIDALPNIMTWRGPMNLRDTPIAALPVGLTVGQLILNDLITAIPANCEIGGPLLLAGSNITSIGGGCRFTGTVRATQAQIDSGLLNGVKISRMEVV